uniref:Putative heavy-metal chelation domain-containing protein n=1 Tax=Candidatus Desulfatibia profunda TaxID=2841695 RepID=A0A8J6NU90_9BACT|nr:hypothetical protein [Candidatus Desulfatibia profunda]
MKNLYDDIRQHAFKLVEIHHLHDEPVRIQARVLSPEEAIGNPEADDFPLQKGKERLMQAEFGTGVGQAFTDQYGHYEGKLKDVLSMPLTNNFRRAVFVAAVNAVMRHLKLIDRTVHCRDKEPAQCAAELVAYIKQRYGQVKVTQVGFQPRMVENLAKEFDYRILDLDPDNIGSRKYGALIEGPETAADAVGWADLLLVTGTILVNATITDFLTKKPILFYGTTIAGAAHLMNWDRFCAKGK